jgi:hypothetical protein
LRGAPPMPTTSVVCSLEPGARVASRSMSSMGVSDAGHLRTSFRQMRPLRGPRPKTARAVPRLYTRRACR